jgi:hypothetical protein
LKFKEQLKDGHQLTCKVVDVVAYEAEKFTEWLIQQGLVKTEQQCQTHTDRNLKLGKYSGADKFPYSGGYVWISRCCPTRFVSVFKRSIFEGAPYEPTVLLKLVFHWARQSNAVQVNDWTKVDNLYLKNFYSWLRSVCTLALQTHMGKMGGLDKKIEFVALKLCTNDGNQVKFEMLGVLDYEQKMVRLRAVEPLADGEQNRMEHIAKILEPLSEWVSYDSTISTDLPVSKNILETMGFKNIIHVPAGKNYSNATITNYLRYNIPRMFTNKMNYLSLEIIQQFLDELVWREQYGTSPGRAFDNIIAHITEQTKANAEEPFTARLAKVAANPYRTWVATKSEERK